MKCVTLTLGLVLVVSIPGWGDTLFNGNKAQAIGKGEVRGKKIHWTDCKGENGREYDKPPFWVDKASNCSMSADAFGLKKTWVTNGKSGYVVADAEKLNSYVSHEGCAPRPFRSCFSQGEPVSFEVTGNKVKIQGAEKDGHPASLTLKH